MSSSPVKFKFNLKFSPALHEDNYLSLEKWRIILYRMGTIGEYKSNSVSYGDLSKRILVGENQFIISGNETGKYANLDGSQYSRVLKCDLKKLNIDASGPIAPSNNSYLHYVLYESCPQINFIFQIDHQGLAEYLEKQNFDSLEIGPDFEQLKQDVQSTIGEKPSGIMLVKSEPHQIITFGATAEIAGKMILETLKESKN